MIYLFNNNEEMIRIIPNSAIKRMYQTQKLTDENYISDRLDVEIQALNDEELSELEYMAIDDIENPQRFHYYFIVKETTEHQVTSLTGVQSGIEELRKTPVYDMRPTNLSPKLIADRLLEGTNWQAGYTTDDVGTISTNFYYTDVFSALKKMCMAFDIEMQFFVEITTNRIGARYIEFRKRTGKSVGKRVVYGHNALKIVKEVEKTNTVTALIGRGKGVQVSESDEGHIGYGRKIGFENVEWKTSSGAPVDKPLGQEFVEIPELTLQYGIKNSNGTVRPKIGFVEFQDEESETRLIDRTYDALLELSRPQVLLETSSVYLPDTGIGDTINVVRHDRDLRYQTRVFEITWDRLANKAVDMKLGDRLGESENKRISRISSQVSGNISTELSSTVDELVDRLTTADGKNTNWYTDYDPMENPETMGLVRVNDNWYQPDPEYEGEFILKQWNGEMWVEILRTSGNPELVRRIEEAVQEAEQAKEAAEQAYEEAVDEAERLVAEQDVVWQGKMDDYDEQVALIDASVTEAQTKAEQALTEAGISTDLAQTAKDLADTAKANASTALSNASQVEQLITQVKTNPTGTITGYNSLKNNVDSMVQAIGSDGGKIAQMVMTDSLFSTKVLEQINVGGVNLVPNSDFSNGRTGWGVNNSEYVTFNDGYISVSGSAGSGVYKNLEDTTADTIYTTSAYVRGKGSIRLGFNSSRGIISFNYSDWTRVSFTGVRGSSGAMIAYTNSGSDNFDIKNIQVEEGNVMTAYGVGMVDKANQSEVTQLADSWALTLKSGNDIKTQINASTNSIRLASKLIHLSGTSLIDDAVIKSAHIDSLNANKITGNTADFNTIRAGVLTANAVTATHIKAENALIDTIFGTTALIERLTSKTAFINSIKAMEIDAGKITTGELNAANVSIVNLDVNKLTGNVMNFISGAFTSNAGSLLLSGNGIRVNFSNGYSLRLNGAGTNYYTSGGQPIGGLLTTTQSAGATHSLSLAARRGYTVSLDYQGSLSYNQSNRALEIDGTTGNITIQRPIYESSGSAGLEFTRSQMGNVGWGLLLASTKATGSGIFLADNGEVWIGISGGYKQFT